MAPSIASARKWPSATQTAAAAKQNKWRQKRTINQRGERGNSGFCPYPFFFLQFSYEGRIFWAEVVVPMKRIRIIVVVVVVVVVVGESGNNTHKYTTKLDDRKKES